MSDLVISERAKAIARGLICTNRAFDDRIVHGHLQDAAHATDVVLALLIRRAILELLAVAPAQPSLS